MNDSNRRRRLFWLGVILISIGLVSLLPLYFISLPDNNAQILSMGIGVILGWGSSAVTFYFGQSEKQEE
jgi:hypothetical protein